MTIAIVERRATSAPLQHIEAIPLWVWWLVAVLASTGLALLAKGSGRTFEFIDSDDALRLIHVRELIAGQPWYDVTTKSLGGNNGLVSHWSRLIDGPMALLLAAFRLPLPEAAAQAALVTIWPMAMLGAVTWTIARTTLARQGTAAAHYALVLATLSLLSYYQFAPGRIDHHNVMIATTVSAVLLIWAWPQDERAWRGAGTLCAIALAIGYEALAPVFVIAGLAAGWGLVDHRAANRAADFVSGLIIALAACLVATVPVSRWLDIACDALSLNIVALAGLAGGGFVVVMRHGGGWSWPRRILVLGLSAGVGMTAYGMLEPACLAGPMGQVPAALGPVWMGQVEEAKSLLGELLRGKPDGTLGPVSIFLVGLSAVVLGLARSTRPADRFLLAASAAFVALALWQMKYLAYASLMLVPGTAVLIAGLPAFGEIRAPLVRLGALLLLNQFVLFSLAMTLKDSLARAPAVATPGDSAPSAGSPQHACTKADAMRAFASLPPGLVVTHNDIGAHLAAATGLRALSGPYHRIPDAIIANHAILSARDPAVAGRLLAEIGADYVLACRPLDAAQIERPGWDGSLLAGLAAGRAPKFLQPVALPPSVDGAYRMWRFDRSRLP